MSFNDSRVIRTVSIDWQGEMVYVPVTYFNPGHSMPFASTPDCPGYDDEGDPGEIDFDTPMMNDVGPDFMEWLCLGDNEEFIDKVFQEMLDV